MATCQWKIANLLVPAAQPVACLRVSARLKGLRTDDLVDGSTARAVVQCQILRPDDLQRDVTCWALHGLPPRHVLGCATAGMRGTHVPPLSVPLRVHRVSNSVRYPGAPSSPVVPCVPRQVRRRVSLPSTTSMAVRVRRRAEVSGWVSRASVMRRAAPCSAAAALGWRYRGAAGAVAVPTGTPSPGSPGRGG